MIKVIVELWPHGFEESKKTLGEAVIYNDVSGTRTSGNYGVRLKTPKYLNSEKNWKQGRVEGFPRQRLNAWDLLYRALHNTVGDRNKCIGSHQTSTTDTKTSSSSATDPSVQ